MSRMLRALRRIEHNRPKASDKGAVAPGSPPANHLPPMETAAPVEPAPGAVPPPKMRQPSRPEPEPPAEDDCPLEPRVLFAARFRMLAERLRPAAAELSAMVEKAAAESVGSVAVFPRVGISRGTVLLTAVADELSRRFADEVLLVDGDYLACELSRRFDYHAWQGFPEVLLGTSNWRHVVVPTGCRGVSFLPGGPMPSGGRLPPHWVEPGGLFGDLRERFRVVLMTAPPPGDPVLQRLICGADAVFPWCEVERTGRRELRRTVAALRRAGAPLAGTVLTFDAAQF